MLAIALNVSVALGGRAAAAPVAGDFFGVDAPDVWDEVLAGQPTTLSAQWSAGVRIVRQGFYWMDIETAPGSYQFSPYDAYMSAAASAHVEVLPVVYGTPTFRSACPADPHPEACPPVVAADMGDFVRVLIGRYGPSGSFWAAHRSLPYVPVRSWQIWNEPNLSKNWHVKDPASGQYTPDPGAYANLLVASAPAIHAADPRAEIVSGGVTDSTAPSSIRMIPYLLGMYAAGVKGAFASLGLHIYCETPDCALRLVQQARQVMNQAGDTAAQIYVTEMGWATDGGPYRFVVPDEATQATYVGQLLGDLISQHEQLGIRGVVNYLWKDGPPGGDWSFYTGLVRNDSSPKPALATWESFANDTTPPTTTLTAGPPATTAATAVGFAFTSSVTPSDFQCRLDRGSWSDCASPVTVSNLARGSHAFAVRAIDWHGNVDPHPPVATWRVQAPGSGGSARLRRGQRLALLGARADRQGRIVLALAAPCPGRLGARASVKVAARRLLRSRSGGRGLRRVRYGAASLRCGQVETVRLVIAPLASARQVLRGAGRVSVSTAVTFTPPRGSGERRSSVYVSVAVRLGGRRG